jgi:hypothetical protein
VNDEDLPEDNAPEKIPLLKYAPVTSCNVEITFSAYKHILSHKRQSITPENMENILFFLHKNSMIVPKDCK